MKKDLRITKTWKEGKITVSKTIEKGVLNSIDPNLI